MISWRTHCRVIVFVLMALLMGLTLEKPGRAAGLAVRDMVAAAAPAPLIASAQKTSCCCRPGHCHMAKCSHNPESDRPAVPSCRCMTSAPTPSPGIVTSLRDLDGVHDAGLCRLTAERLDIAPLSYHIRPDRDIRSGHYSIPEEPPRAI